MILKSKTLALAAGAAAGVFTLVYSLPGATFRLLQAIGRRSAGVRSYSIKIGGNRSMAYLRGGNGDPLICIHGFAGEKDHWTRIAKFLTGRFDFIAPDLPGFGASSRSVNDSYSIHEQAERIHEFTTALGLSRFHLAGHSMGGQIAAAYASKYPNRVASLWLVAPAGVMLAESTEVIDSLQSGENPLIVRSPEDLIKVSQLIFHAPPWVPRPVIYYIGKRDAHSADWNERVFQEAFGKPIASESLVRGIKIPTFITWGEDDRVVHQSGAAILGELIPECEVKVMEKTGHIPIMEHPQEVANDFLHFIARRQNVLQEQALVH